MAERFDGDAIDRKPTRDLPSDNQTSDLDERHERIL
jgi:hypothetical protein